MQKGDLVDINSDLATKDLREVRFLNFNPFSGFSDAGHIAIQATFSDFDSAIFVSYAVANLVVGDVNQDSLINLLDIEPFVELLSSGFFQAEADINQDGLVNLLDIEGFVSLLSGGG
jgi:hypothetical protein